MIFSKPLFSLLFFVMIMQSTLCAQSVKFKIMRGDDNIGNITAYKKKTGVKTTYSVNSEAKFRVVFKYIRETATRVVFFGNELFSSDLKQTMNGELKEHRTATKKGSEYTCKKNPGNESFLLKKKITFCTSMLFFQEPKGETQVFAESYQELCPLKLIDKGIYELTLPGDKINHYVYKNGVLQEVRVFRAIVDLVFERE